MNPKFSTESSRNRLQNSKISWPGMIVTTGILGTIYTSIFVYQDDHRWDAPKEPFYVKSNFSNSGIDKIGHFYAAKTQASVISDLYQLSNVSKQTSVLLGLGAALSVQTLIELKDGRMGSGFDVYDEAADFLGAGWFLARENSKFLQRFNVRWLYYPSEDRKYLDEHTQFNEDYSGLSYWLSMQVGDIIPFWPKFIVPAGGLTLNNWRGEVNSADSYLSYHVSLNPDFARIIPQKTAFERTITHFLNGFYIPAPAVEVYPHLGFSLVFHENR